MLRDHNCSTLLSAHESWTWWMKFFAENSPRSSVSLFDLLELSVCGSKPSKLDYALEKQIIISLMNRNWWWSARCNLVVNACIKGKHTTMSEDISLMLHNGPKTSSVVICDLVYWSWSLRSFGGLMRNYDSVFFIVALHNEWFEDFVFINWYISRVQHTGHLTSRIISCLPNTICTFYTYKLH